MSIFAYLALFAAILYFVAIFLLRILKAAGQVAESANASLNNLFLTFPLIIRKVLGRGSVAAKPTIDDQILPGADVWLRRDEVM